MSPPSTDAKPKKKQSEHWRKSLQVVYFILGVWFLISLGCGVLFRDLLDANLPNIGGAPFGFWMAQQGSIIGFLVLLFVYMLLMNRLDKTCGLDDGDRA
jgi:putative solute:sodium symporter small subunit